MRSRRDFVTLLGGAAGTWPLAAGAQQAAMPVVGFLNQESAEMVSHLVTGFRKGLSETGFAENKNVAIEYRWAEGRYERLPQLAADLVNRKVAVIVAAYFPSAIAAKAATTTIPIVFISGVDPIAAGLVTSLNQPGGNLTGLSNYNTSLTAKRLELLHQVVPRAEVIAVLVNSTSPARQTIETEARSAAQTLGLRLDVLGASTEGDIDAAVAAAAQRGAGALLVAGDAYFNSRRAQPRDCVFYIVFGTLQRAATNSFLPWWNRPVNLALISHAMDLDGAPLQENRRANPANPPCL
jgi:putative ABC transport system substrate-binding protein